MAALTGVASGLYDLRTALARARFLDRPYVAIVLAKNGLKLAMAVGAAMAATYLSIGAQFCPPIGVQN